MKKIKLVSVWMIMWMVLSVNLTGCGGGSSSKVKHKSGRFLNSTLVAKYAKNAANITGLNSRYAVNVYRIIYETKDKDGSFINVSGLLSVPQKGAQSKSPMLLYHHGTQYENREAPSVNIHNASTYVLPAYIGFITASPDYIGYGESLGKQHPYLVAKLTASTSIDLLRASNTFLKQEHILSNKQLFLGGYSQGGGAVLASQKMLEEELTDEFTVTASSAGAGSYAFTDDLMQSSQEILDKFETFEFARPSNIGLIFKAMDSIYDLNILDRIFQPEYVSVVDTIYDGSHGSDYIDSKLTRNANKLIKKAFLQDILAGKEEGLLNAFKTNDLYDWKPKAPTMLYHGREDDWVRFSHAQKAYATMQANGATNVQLVECIAEDNQPTNHANCFVPYLLKSYEFFRQYATDL